MNKTQFTSVPAATDGVRQAVTSRLNPSTIKLHKRQQTLIDQA